MLSVSLCSAGASLALLSLDEADAEAVNHHVARWAAGGSTITAKVVGRGGEYAFVHDREVAAAQGLLHDVLSASGMVAEASPGRAVTGFVDGDSVTFDRLRVVDDDLVTSDFPLGAPDRQQFTHEGAIKAWDTRGRSGEPATSAGKHQLSKAQVDAAKREIADALREAGQDWERRAAVLSRLDAEGDATTLAEFDRIAGDQYTPERQALHDRIIDDVLAAAGHVPADRKAVLLGGLSGSGKSSAVDNFGGKYDDLAIDSSQYLHLDPDKVKGMLLERGAIERVAGMTAGEHAGLLHEESGHIVDQLRREAEKRGTNIIIDKTMSKPPTKDIKALKDLGYRVRGVFVDIPVDESLRSADDRWRGKHTDSAGNTTYSKPGVESDARFVPPPYIESSRVEGHTSKNLLAFQEVSHLFDDWSVVDHSGISETPRNPKATIRHGSGRAELAVARMVFSGTSIGARRAWDVIGRGPHGGAAADAASRADIVVGEHAVRVAPAAAPALIEDLGSRPAPSDLTKVHIVGHPNLFADVARNNLRRVDMPQIPTARLGDFDRYLHERGITTKLDRVDPATLSATQNELDGRKTGQMLTKLRSGTMVGAEHPLWISSDNKLLDGHHRWAAEAALSVGEAPRTVTVVRASVPMAQLIEHARTFGRANDIDTKHHGFSTVHSSLDERLAWFTSEGARKAWITRRQGMPAATEDAPAAPGAGPGNGLPTAAEFDAMEHTGGPLGSQGGGWYRDTHGQRYLVKPAQSEAHAHNELAASLVLAALNVPGDQTGIFAKGSKWYIAKKAIQGPDGKLGKIVGHDMTPELQRQARDGFGADAVMSSWDAFGLVGDNVITEGGVLHRIDVGGSLAYRAMGGDKASFNPGKAWVEPTTLRTSNQGKALYGTMTDAETANQLEKLNSLDIDALDRRLGQAGIIPAVRTRTIDTIRDRIDNQLPGIVDQLRHG